MLISSLFSIFRFLTFIFELSFLAYGEQTIRIEFRTLPKAKPQHQGHVEMCIPNASDFNCNEGFFICYPATVLPIKKPSWIVPGFLDDDGDPISEPEEPWETTIDPSQFVTGFLDDTGGEETESPIDNIIDNIDIEDPWGTTNSTTETPLPIVAGFLDDDDDTTSVSKPKYLKLNNIAGNPVTDVCEAIRKEKGSMYPGKQWHGIMIKSYAENRFLGQIKLQISLSFSPKKYHFNAVMNTEQYCLHLNLGDESSKYATLTEMPSRGIELTDEVEKWKQNKTDLAISLIPFDWVAYKGFRHYVTIQPSQCSIFGNLRKMRQAIRYIKKVTKEPLLPKKCNATWESAKPALIRDLIPLTDPQGNAVADFWDKTPDEYVVRVGFLNKFVEVQNGKLDIAPFENLQQSIFDNQYNGWNREHFFINDFLMPNVRDLLDTMDYDYTQGMEPIS